MAAGLVLGATASLIIADNNTESSSPSGAETSIARDFSYLDGQYALHGRQKIEGLVMAGQEVLTVRTLRWIKERGHNNLFDLVAVSLGGRSLNIQTHACVLLKTMDPVLLKSHVPLMQQALGRIKDPGLLQAAQDLVARVESS